MSSSKKLQSNFSIASFKAGQPAAFSSVFDHYYPALCYFATRLIQDVTAAEDIAQETLIKLWEKHEAFHNVHAIRSFLYITTRNACFNFMKRLQVGEKNHEEWSQVWDEYEDFVLNQLTRAEVLREVYNMLNMLPPECRKVMRHSFVDGLDNHQIAKLLNISVHTVKNQKARAIYLIRKKLGGKALLMLSLLVLEMQSGRVAGYEDRIAAYSIKSFTFDYKEVNIGEYRNS
jgi:RNA polymerase sigma-70 factor (family 1)